MRRATRVSLAPGGVFDPGKRGPGPRLWRALPWPHPALPQWQWQRPQPPQAPLWHLELGDSLPLGPTSRACVGLFPPWEVWRELGGRGWQGRGSTRMAPRPLQAEPRASAPHAPDSSPAPQGFWEFSADNGSSRTLGKWHRPGEEHSRVCSILTQGDLEPFKRGYICAPDLSPALDRRDLLSSRPRTQATSTYTQLSKTTHGVSTLEGSARAPIECKGALVKSSPRQPSGQLWALVSFHVLSWALLRHITAAAHPAAPESPAPSAPPLPSLLLSCPAWPTTPTQPGRGRWASYQHWNTPEGQPG